MTTPTYIKQLFTMLEDEYSVDYYQELDMEYVIFDCFILNGFCIKIDRLPVDDLSKEDMSILVNSVRDLYITLNNKWRELGHEGYPV